MQFTRANHITANTSGPDNYCTGEFFTIDFLQTASEINQCNSGVNVKIAFGVFF